MKAVRAHAYGPPDVLAYEDVTTPRPGPGEVLIRVESAAVNYADVKRRRNDPYPFPTPLPFVPGGEVAGVVETLGEGAAAPPPGTPVFALAGADGSGGYAQYVLAPAAQVIPLPADLGPDEASGLLVAGSTAVLALTAAGRVAAGEHVLVQGAGGGVGGYAVQVAALLGGTVIGAAGSPARREAALAWGADHVVDYTRPGWEDRVLELTGGRGVDVVLEMTGGDVSAASLACLAPFGRMVVIGMAGTDPLRLDPDALLRFFYDPAPNQTLQSFNLGAYFGLHPDAAGEALHRLIGWVVSGQVKVPVGEILPLSEAAGAHRMLEERRTTGKIVLKPWADA